MTTQPETVRRPVRSSIIAGLVVLLLIAAAGGALALLQPSKWSASSSFVVLPRSGLDTADAASYYETLSRGQIAATFSEIAANSTEAQKAIAGLGLPASVASTVTDDITVVPNTSVILVTVTASQPATAEQVADRVTDGAIADLTPVAQPYTLSRVATAAGTAARAGTSPTEVLIVAAVVAIAGGVLVQQIVYQLTLVLRRRRQTDAPVVGADAVLEEPVMVGRA